MRTGGAENEMPAEECGVIQSYTELSNVNIVKKMIRMINIARVCESYQKVIQSLDEIDTGNQRCGCSSIISEGERRLQCHYVLCGQQRQEWRRNRTNRCHFPQSRQREYRGI